VDQFTDSLLGTDAAVAGDKVLIACEIALNRILGHSCFSTDP
jgi:hypothetical protein